MNNFYLPYGVVPHDSVTYNYDNSKRRFIDYETGITFNVRAGAGHIDDVSFAAAAMNMLDKIAENEKSYKKCGSGHIRELAALIEKNRKRRTLDSRIAFIENIDTLSEFILKKGIAEELSPRTVLELADQWNYAFHQTRKKGIQVVVYPEAIYNNYYLKRISANNDCELGLRGFYRLSENSALDFSGCDTSHFTESTWKSTTRTFDYSLNVAAYHERPLSRLLQLSIESRGYAGITRTMRDNFVTDMQDTIRYSAALPMVRASETISFSYYPNTRTTIEISESAGYERKFDYFDMESKRKSGAGPVVSAPEYDYRNLWVSLGGSARYWFSPQLEVVADAGLSWNTTYLFSHSDPWTVKEYGSELTDQFSYHCSAYATWKLF